MSEGGGAGLLALERRRGALGAAAAVALLVIAVVLAVVGGGGGSNSGVQTAPRLVNSGDLEEAEDSLGHFLYWVGPQAGEDLELTVGTDGSAYLRYLPPGTEAGDPRTTFLTVGTYPVPEPQGALQRTAEEDGARLRRLADGSVVLPNPASAGSVYLAYPDSDLEIEVYDPEPGRAMELIRSGAVEPVGG
jgi:hypothetical protein